MRSRGAVLVGNTQTLGWGTEAFPNSAGSPAGRLRSQVGQRDHARQLLVMVIDHDESPHLLHLHHFGRFANVLVFFEAPMDVRMDQLFDTCLPGVSTFGSETATIQGEKRGSA
jgi:hypothetical protein